MIYISAEVHYLIIYKLIISIHLRKMAFSEPTECCKENVFLSDFIYNFMFKVGCTFSWLKMATYVISKINIVS